MTWLNEIERFLQDTGQDGVFFVKDQHGQELSLLTCSGMFTIEDARAHVERLKTDGDAYDLENMKTSGTAIMNAIGATLHSDLLFMLIVKSLQASSASVWRNEVDKLKALRLRTEPGENVDKMADKISAICRALEGANQLPEDVTVIICNVLMACTVEPFKMQFVVLYTECDLDPAYKSWNELIINNIVLFQVLPHLFQYRKGSTRTGGKFDPATGFVFF
jgi:hypothetical protein